MPEPPAKSPDAAEARRPGQPGAAGPAGTAARPADAGIFRPAAEAALVAAALVLFALTVHTPLPWTLIAAAGLAVAATAIGVSLAGAPAPWTLLGLVRPCGKTVAMTAAGLVVGIGLATTYRTHLGLAALPAGAPGAFVLLACLIGAAEEAVYRGYVQGRLAGLGWPAAVGLAALAHAAYKTSLFTFPAAAAPQQVPYAFLAAWTLAGGIAFGLLRQFSGSLIPPVAAHAAFDLIVYGAMADAPWWVWG
jgi:membrane protease YdiL (CAAX protease family)